jgi:tetratricopeptide (TPR) repeat protein
MNNSKTLRRTSNLVLHVGIAVVIVGLLCTHWKPVRDAWSRNMQNVSFMHNANGDCTGASTASASTPSGGVLCSSEQSEQADEWAHTWFSNDLTACQMLWASRLQASQSLESAKEAFGQAVDCRRQPLVVAWGGELAWLENDRQLARQWWQKMGTGDLADWGYALLLDERIEQGEVLLELAVEQEAGRSGQPSQWPLTEPAASTGADALFRLGHALRMRGDWSQATDRYEAAHRMAPENTEVAFYLGMSYRQTGQPEKAVAMLEEGLEHLPTNRPGFVSDYFVQLGLAHRDGGSDAKAVKAFQQAKNWLDKLGTPRPEQEGFIQDLLDQSLRSIDGTP